MLRYSHCRKVVTTALFGLFGYAVLLLLVWRTDSAIAMENGLMENLQAGALAIACILWIPCVFRPVSTISRFACWSLFLVMLSMFLREVDVETLQFVSPITPSLVWIGSGFGRNLILGSLFMATAVVFVYYRHELIGQLIEFVFSVTGMLLFIGGGLYVCSLPFDKNMLGLPYRLNQFCEEAVECGATLMFLVAAGHNLLLYVTTVRANPRRHPTPLPPSGVSADQVSGVAGCK